VANGGCCTAGCDDVFAESEEYDDGFAKVVHGTQPANGQRMPRTNRCETAAKDFGICLGWDDETDRCVDESPVDGGSKPGRAHALLRCRYRVDVREANMGAPFTSLAAVTADLALDDIPLGRFDGELVVETLPVQLPNGPLLWLPAYFAAWAGASMVTANAAALEFGVPSAQAIPNPYTPVGADAVALRYGHDYDFRCGLRISAAEARRGF
jgi:hypothetical protein